MSGLLGKIPKFTLKLPAALGKGGRTMSECPLELSFSLCEESSSAKQKTEDQFPHQVNLPKEDCKQMFEMENQDTLEKAEEEKSEKEDNMEVTCSVSVDGQEKQEFSFTLYDFDTRDKVNKQGVEKVVVRSICEALGKTLKLPPSGSRTIKVKLAISPDSSKDIDTKEQEGNSKWPTESPETVSPSKIPDYNSSKSANTASTYLMSSVAEKPPPGSSRYHNSTPACPPLAANIISPDAKAAPSPKLRPARNGRLVSLQRQELKNCVKEHEKKTVNDNIPDNRQPQNEAQNVSEEAHNCQNHPQQTNRDHVPECRDRRNHYLDLAGIENDVKHANEPSNNPFIPAYVDPNYICPYRILDRTHICSKSHRTKEGTGSPLKKPSILCHPKVSAGSAEASQAYRTRISADAQDDLLNLNFDLCDLVPEAKFDWENIQHRRSKSYDLYESEVHNTTGLYSPKLKQRPSQNATTVVENQKNPNHINSSPVHHYRHRHRDRERQRAMQQVANWIAREHSNNKEQNATQFLCGGFSKSALVDRHEHHHQHEHVHHHQHEHVHHHYHHLVEL